MKESDLFVWLFSGMAFFAALAVLLVRRTVLMALSLGILFMAVAGIFAGLRLQAAFYSQLVLYIGGVMVLIGFALQLYNDPPGKVSYLSVRESFGKGILLMGILMICLLFAPWEAVLAWKNSISSTQEIPPDYSLKQAGRFFITSHTLEFEWLGILMLIGLLAAGWFLKDLLQMDKK
jgi:NADH:ubiquinone oxidoreductase subunit 6 (subunit J)